MGKLEPFLGKGAILRRNWILFFAMLATVLSAPFLLWWGASTHSVSLVFGMPVALADLFVAYEVWKHNLFAHRESVELQASWEGLRIGKIELPLSEVRDGKVTPTRSGARVRLARGFGRLGFDLEVASVAKGHKLLRALGLAASQTLAKFSLPSRAMTNDWWPLLLLSPLVAGVAGSSHGPGNAAVSWFLVALSFLVQVVVFVMPTHLHVGADGVVMSWFGRKRFVGYGDVSEVDAYDIPFIALWNLSNRRLRGVCLTLRSGESVYLPVSGLGQKEQVLLMEKRISQSLTAYRRGGTRADAELLERGSRDVVTWMRQLRSLGTGANVTLRTAPIEADRLWRILEDPSAEAESRAGAAVALAIDASDESKHRLRAAAAGTASHGVRIAIETAVSDDDAAIEEALAGVDRVKSARVVADDSE